MPDVLQHGVTYWNYVGEPVHYVLNAIEKECGGDEARILKEVANNSKNLLKYAIGNGAAAPASTRPPSTMPKRTAGSGGARFSPPLPQEDAAREEHEAHGRDLEHADR